MASLLQQRLRASHGGGQAAEGGGVQAAKAQRQVTTDTLERIRKQLYSRIDGATLAQKNDPKIQQQLKRLVAEILDKEAPDLPRMQRPAIIAQLMDDAIGYGPIQPLIEDPEITEIMVNRWDQVYYEKGGKKYETDIRFRDDTHVRNIIEKIVGPLGRRIDESSPMVDARLPDGSRVHAKLPPISLDGPSITIRKFGQQLSMEELINNGTITQQAAELIEGCVQGGLNVIVSGGTGSGKTTLLNCVSSFIPDSERIITIEDAAELKLQQRHVLRREARGTNVEGKGEITIRDLVISALRERPDRIVVGECRGPEALDMLQAMNTGHDGCLTTVHANSPEDIVSRLEIMVLYAKDLPIAAIRRQIASAVDMIVHIARLRDGSRRVINISEVGTVLPSGIVEIKDIYNFNIAKEGNGKIIGHLEPTGYTPTFLKKLAWRGIVFPANLFQAQGGEGA